MSAAAEAELSEDERAGLELVRETGGIYQSEFWKRLDVSSRKGSRIVESLLEEELINREEAVEELLSTGIKAYKTSGPVEDDDEPSYEDDGMMGHDDEYVF